MRTCKDISDDLVRAKRRCESSFKLKEKSNIDGDIEFHPIFLATKDGRILKITLTPCYYHPYSGEPMSFAWTKFDIDEGPICGVRNRLAVPVTGSNISCMPYETLYMSNKIPDGKLWTAVNTFRVLDSVLVFLHDYYDNNIANKIIPYKKWWGNANIAYSVCAAYDQPTFPKKGYASILVPFDHKHFIDFIMDDIEMNRHMLDMHVLTNANKLNAEVRTALKSKEGCIVIPIDLNLNEWVADYIDNVLNPVCDKIRKIIIGQTGDGKIAEHINVYIDKDVAEQAIDLIDDIPVDDLMDEWANTFDDRLITEKDLKLKDAKAKW